MPEQPANYLGCDFQKLFAASSCLQTCLNEEDRLALEIYVRCLELAVDSTDYITGGVTALMNDAKGWVGPSTPLNNNHNARQAIALYIDIVNAELEGAPPPASSGLPKEAVCFRCLDTETKRNLILYLKCRLNSIDEPE